MIEPPGERRFHHPDFTLREMRGWKAAEAEGRLSDHRWRGEQK
jgi:agmatinase